MAALTTGLFLGLLLGMRHALEPDHLAAVSTLASAPGRRQRGILLGAFWGVGHSFALLLVGCVLAALHARLPTSVAGGFELLVALMLVTLGTRAIIRARLFALTGPMTFHQRGVRAHAHPGDMKHVRVWSWALASQPLAVGLVHGLAGSGALTALVLADMPSVATRLAYMALFGIGSVMGMAFLTGIAGWPLARLGRSGSFSRGLSAVTGAFSVLLGTWWGWSTLRALLDC